MRYKPKYEPDDYIIREHNGYISAYKIIKIVDQFIETTDRQKLFYPQYKMNMLYSVSGGIDYDVYNDVAFFSCEPIDNNKIFSHINKDEKPVKLPVANQLYSLKGTEGQSIVIVISVNENNVTYRSLKDSESTKTKPSILFFHFFEEYNESSETRSKPDQTHGKR
jgi:hypothetical protein